MQVGAWRPVVNVGWQVWSYGERRSYILCIYRERQVLFKKELYYRAIQNARACLMHL